MDRKLPSSRHRRYAGDQRRFEEFRPGSGTAVPLRVAVAGIDQYFGRCRMHGGRSTSLGRRRDSSEAGRRGGFTDGTPEKRRKRAE